jgi:predicted dehydrogenase
VSRSRGGRRRDGEGAPRASEAVIVGAGLMGGWHADAVRRSGHRVAAVVDVDLSRASALASRHPGARAARSLADVVAPGRVVHVCVPLERHAGLAATALDSGCHALVEKPLAASAAETSALLERARASGRMLVPVHQCLFQRGAERARRVLPSLGPVLHVDAVACTAGADGRGDAWRDRLTVEVLPHPLSLLARLVDGAVDGVAWQVARPAAGELRVTGALRGASVSLLVSTHGRPTRHALQLVCAGGTLCLDLFHGYAVLSRGATTRAGKLVLPFVEAGRTLTAAAGNLAGRAARRESAYPGLRALVAHVYAAVDGGGAPPIADGETLAVSRAVDAIVAGLPLSTRSAAPASAVAHRGTRDGVAAAGNP